MSDFTVRTATEDEWEDAMGLAYRTFRKFVEKDYPKEGVENFVDFISDPHLFRMFQMGEYHLWVAESSGGDIVGMGSLRSGSHISLLFVEDKWQLSGVGRRLMEEMESFVKGSGFGYITVNASPYGIPFYHRLGFEDLGGMVLNGGMYVTPMKKDL